MPAHAGSQSRATGTDDDNVAGVSAGDSATAKRPPGAKGQPRLRRPRHSHELTEHVVVGRFNPLEQLEVDAVHDFGRHEARGIAARHCHSAGEVFASATRLLRQRRTDFGDRSPGAAPPTADVVLGASTCGQVCKRQGIRSRR